MGSRMFLLLVFVLLIFTDHSQGVPETHEKFSIISTFTDASAVGKPLTAANPINTPRQHNRLCNCRGMGREMVSTPCLCQLSARGNRKLGKLEAFCKRKKNKNLKKCSRFYKPGGKTSKVGPSTPI